MSEAGGSDQAEFLSILSNIEASGILAIKKEKISRDSKVIYFYILKYGENLAWMKSTQNLFSFAGQLVVGRKGVGKGSSR